jgi:FAD/FMN-containing dehydrogenase
VSGPTYSGRMLSCARTIGRHVGSLLTFSVGYGGAAPRVRGSVVVDLGRRMNKILDLNPDDCTCLVEPGVTYYALYEEVQKRGYKHLWIDTADLGGGSVMGNALDRGVGYTLYGDRKLVFSVLLLKYFLAFHSPI